MKTTQGTHNTSSVDNIRLVSNLGLSTKAAKAYLALLELGEATIQSLAKKAGLKRTTLYYTIDELTSAGALIKTKRNKKVFYIPAEPASLLKATRARIFEVEESIDQLEAIKHSVYKKPRVDFLYGPQGFKHIWDMIFASPSKEYSIITDGASFLDFVREKYILQDIIKKKRELGIKSRQIIMDSEYAKKIVAKDSQENRQSKIISPRYKLPFTEVICDGFVAFISPRWDDMLFVIENENFAKTRKNLFEALWEKI